MIERISISFEKFNSMSGLYDDYIAAHERAGFVYLIVDGKRMKIGSSRRPIARIKEIIPMAGIVRPKIFISNKCKFYMDIEKFIHEKFAANRIVGEWFKITTNEVFEGIKAVKVKHIKGLIRAIGDADETLNN